MLGYSDLLSASNLPPEEQLEAAQIGEQVRRTTALVASLLTFARQAPARLALVDINSVLQTAERLLAPQLEAEAVSIRFELASSLPTVLADSNQILHVCTHLAGWISANLNRETHPTLLVRTHSEGGVVLVDFAADDPSANPASQPLLFSSVFSSENSTQPPSLSLSACCRIVEEQGGRLLQASAPGNTAFRMELRVAPSSASRVSFAPASRTAAHV